LGLLPLPSPYGWVESHKKKAFGHLLAQQNRVWLGLIPTCIRGIEPSKPSPYGWAKPNPTLKACLVCPFFTKETSFFFVLKACLPNTVLKHFSCL